MREKWRHFRYPAAAALAIALVALLLFRREPAPAISVTLGDEVTVFDYPSDACDRLDIPDTPARAFRDASGTVNLFASHRVTRRSTGPELDALTHNCEVVMDSHEDPGPDQFNDREWIAATWTPDGTRVAALVHNEYQGHRHPGRCPSGVYRECWYNSITLAASEDGGRSFSQGPPAAHVVAAPPTRYVPGTGPKGLFSASNIVPGPDDDGYLYSMVHLIGDDTSGTCLMRTSDPFDAGSWRAWDGEGFGHEFVDPYTGDAGTETCHPVAPDRIGTMRHSLTFNRYLDRYLLIGVAGGGREPAGIYLSTSQDLIDWTPRTLVMEAELPWSFECGDEFPINYPSLLDPESPSRNFDITGRTGFLYFTRLDYSGCRGRLDRDLIRVPVTLEAG